MLKDNRLRVVVLLAVALLLQGFQSTYAKSKAKANETVSYSFTHAIPAGYGADVVDVYAMALFLVQRLRQFYLQPRLTWETIQIFHMLPT